MGTTWETQAGLVRITDLDGERNTFPISAIRSVSADESSVTVRVELDRYNYYDFTQSNGWTDCVPPPGLEDFLVELMSHPAVTFTPDGWDQP